MPTCSLNEVESSVSFYVTSPRGGEARIHKSSCSYCKDGKGFGSIFKARRNNTVWSPPLATLVEAEAYARNHHGKVVRCGHCLAPSADIDDDLAKKCGVGKEDKAAT